MGRRPARLLDSVELLKRLERGPASLQDGNISPELYKLWVETWIIPQVKRLIPELAKREQRRKEAGVE